MKCPDCNVDLAPAQRDGVYMDTCGACGGMWVTPDNLNALEDQTFDLGDQEKGTLVFSSEAASRACPSCSTDMRRFAYRLYDLELEYCPEGHGYWLEAGEDQRVMQLMREEERRLNRSGTAEQHWKTLLHHLHSHSIWENIRSLLR